MTARKLPLPPALPPPATAPPKAKAKAAAPSPPAGPKAKGKAAPSPAAKGKAAPSPAAKAASPAAVASSSKGAVANAPPSKRSVGPLPFVNFTANCSSWFPVCSSPSLKQPKISACTLFVPTSRNFALSLASLALSFSVGYAAALICKEISASG